MVDGWYNGYLNRHLYLIKGEGSSRFPIVCLTRMITEFNHINIFNETGEISFKIEYDENTKKIYDLFIERVTHLRLDGFGEFVVDDIDETIEGEYRCKVIVAKDEEYMLNYRLLSLVNNSSTLFNGVLWTTDLTKSCLMREVLSNIPSWSIGTVDSEITTNPLTFKDVRKQNMLKFI